jgi:hypothetical protein
LKINDLIDDLIGAPKECEMGGDGLEINGFMYHYKASVRFWRNFFTRKRGHTMTIRLEYKEKY